MSMRESEEQVVSDLSTDAGMRAGSTGLFLLVRPREKVMKTKKRAILFMVAVRHSGSRVAERQLLE